jgi:predicted deacetylase
VVVHENLHVDRESKGSSGHYKVSTGPWQHFLRSTCRVRTSNVYVSTDSSILLQCVLLKMQPNNNHKLWHKNEIRSRPTSM